MSQDTLALQTKTITGKV